MKNLVLAVALAVGTTGLVLGDAGANEGKDLCLAASETCPERVDSIVERLVRLKTEMSKGSTVYTEQELTRLEAKLADYRMLAANLYYRGN